MKIVLIILAAECFFSKMSTDYTILMHCNLTVYGEATPGVHRFNAFEVIQCISLIGPPKEVAPVLRKSDQLMLGASLRHAAR